MFPRRGPGIGLLLLRVSVAVTLGAGALDHPGVSSSRWLMLSVSTASLSLAVGLMTPIVSVALGVFVLADIVTGPASSRPADWVALFDAVALALLGPGAYSVDAHRFGRRVTVLRARSARDPLF